MFLLHTTLSWLKQERRMCEVKLLLRKGKNYQILIIKHFLKVFGKTLKNVVESDVNILTISI